MVRILIPCVSPFEHTPTITIPSLIMKHQSRPHDWQSKICSNPDQFLMIPIFSEETLHLKNGPERIQKIPVHYSSFIIKNFYTLTSCIKSSLGHVRLHCDHLVTYLWKCIISNFSKICQIFLKQLCSFFC